MANRFEVAEISYDELTPEALAGFDPAKAVLERFVRHWMEMPLKRPIQDYGPHLDAQGRSIAYRLPESGDRY